MRLAVVGLLVLALMLTAVRSATAVPVKPCGNYGFPVYGLAERVVRFNFGA